MARYKVQAPDGSIITIEGPDGASQDEIVQKAQSIYKKPEAAKAPEKTAGDYVKDFGKATASLADTGLNAVTGTLDWAAYPLARASGLSPEQATQQTTSPKDVIGRAFGITQDPAYTGEASRQITGYLGENIGGSVVKPISEVTGLPEQDVGNMVGTAGMLAPGVGRVAMPAVKATGQAIGDIAKGAVGRGTGYIAKPGEVPTGYQVPSSRIPLGDTFTPAEEWAKFQRGELPYGQFPQTKPIQELPTNRLEKAALMMSGGEIPAAGQGFKAFGERLGETYRNPITAAVDIGSAAFTGLPLYTMGKGLVAGTQAAADALLARKGFDPALPQKMAAYRSGQIPMPGTPPVAAPVAPTPAPNYPLTVQGPGQAVAPSVIPMSGPQRAVNIEGQRFNLPHQINTANSAAQTPKQFSQNLAAQKLQQSVQPQAPAPQPPQPVPRAIPRAMPQTSESVQALQQKLNAIDEQTTQLHSENVGRVQPDTPEGSAYQKQMDDMYKQYKDVEKQIEAAKKAEKEAEKKAKAAAKKPSKKKGPDNVSQMLTEEQGKMWNSLRAEENPFEQKVAGMSQASRDLLEKEMKKNMKANDPEVQRILNIFEKYRINK